MRFLDVCHKPSFILRILVLSILLNLLVITMFTNREILHGAFGNGTTVGIPKDFVPVKSRIVVVKDKSHLILDERRGPNASIIFKRIAKEIPYLPIEDLNNIRYKDRNFNRTCAPYPSYYDLKIHNDYWQEFLNRKIKYYLFGAYFDRRPTVTRKIPVIRILAMINFISSNDKKYPRTFCQIWYREQAKPVLSPVQDLRRLWDYSWGDDPKENYGHLLSCPVLKKHKSWIPKTVSLVSLPCGKATNTLRVVYEPVRPNEEQKEFAVCVKGLDYPYNDISHRLVEYIEVLRSLGAEKVTMYELQVHANASKVLKHYERSGFLELRQFSLSLEVGNLKEYRHLDMLKNLFPYIMHEVIPYNDCLFRNMYRFKYIAVIDVDEIPMPMGNFTNWHELMQFGERIKSQEKCTNFASFCFRCIYFPKYSKKPPYTNEIPEYFYMMQHVYRVKEHVSPEFATKCLHNTDYVIATHNHFPMHWVKNVCPNYSFDPADAQMHHYREPDEKETLDDPVIDKSLWRFRDEVVERSMKVFEDLNFFQQIIYDEESLSENSNKL